MMSIALVVTRSSLAGFLFFLISILSIIAGSTIVHLITLPIEWNSSFNKALPILKEGYVREADIPAIERILKAVALTYVSVALMSILNIWRWIALVFRR